MSVRNDGGPAFPLHPGIMPEWKAYAGMSLRDWFAGQAMVGVAGGYWANPEMSGMNPSELVDEALRLADAMLEARK